MVQESENISLTLKIQIYPDKEQQRKLLRTMDMYTRACDWLSNNAFKKGVYNAQELQKEYYDVLRNNYHLKAQMAVSVTRTVAAKYKVLRTQLKHDPWTYTDKETGEYYKYPRDLSWLTYPIRFKSLQLDLVRERDWCFKKECISLNTIEDRITVPFNSKTNNGIFDKSIHFGTARVVYKNGLWFFHISYSVDSEESEITNIVGIDRGIVNMYYLYDSRGNSDNKPGDKLQSKRDKYQKTRSSPQSKGTKGAKRVLKRISGRENRWMQDVNHCAAKTLVNKYGKGTLFVLEDLVDVSFDNLSTDKSLNYEKRSWSFYDFQLKLEYKAKMIGSTVAYIDPSYTSQRCPVCGTIDKDARNRNEHKYFCKKCGFIENDDLVGAMNIYTLGVRLLNGEDNPHYIKPKTSA